MANKRNKKRNNYKGNKYPNKKDREDRSTVEEQDSEQGSPSPTNDPFWYAQSPELLRDAASIPWVAAAGVEQNISTTINPSGVMEEYDPVSQTTSKYHQYQRLNQAGLQIIKLAPTIGFSDEPNSPVNIAANALYTKVRYQNSGSKNYDAPDLMIYCLAMSEVYSALNWLIRTYGVMSMFSQRNRFVPEKLLAAEGISYSSIRDNLASFRYGVNLLITKAASLCVPSTFTLFLRRAFVYSGIYTEGTSMKDQLYMYSPDGFYFYGLDKDGAGCLHYETRFGRLAGEMDLHYAQLISVVNEMLDAIIQSEDCQVMSGDILKAYGEANVLKLGTLSPDYTVVPTFDIAVLEQMKNAVIFPCYVNTNDILQDATKGYLTCDPTVALHESVSNRQTKYFSTAPVITTSTNDPEPAITMENTRLTVVIRQMDEAVQVGEEYWYVFHLLTGTEMPVDIVNLTWLFTDSEVRITYPTRYVAYYSGNYHSNMFGRPGDMDMFETLATRMNFKFAPGFWVVKQVASSEAGVDVDSFTTYVCDLDNFTVQDARVLNNLHETAIMSELDTPVINKTY